MNQIQFFRVDAVAHNLGVSTDFVNKQIRLKRLNSTKIGRCRIISSADVEAFVLAAQQAQTVRA